MAFSKARRLSDFIAADGSIPTGKFASSTITSAHLVDGTVAHADLHTNMDLTGKTVLVSTQSASDNDTSAASTAYVTTAIANLIDSAPGTMNTLNEIAAALNDDANFNTTVTNAIAAKAPLANPDFTGQLQVSNSASTIQELTVTGNNTRSTLRLNSKDSSGNSVDLRMHSLGDGPRGEIFTFSNHDLAFATNNSSPKMTLDTGGRLGIQQTPAANNFTLQVQGMQTNGTDGRVAYFRGYGTATSIGTTGPTVVLQNANNTVNNYTKLSFESAGAGETVSINSHNRDHTNHYGDMVFNTRGSGGYSEKMRIEANGSIKLAATTASNGHALFSTGAYGSGQGDNKTHFGYNDGGTYKNFIRGAFTLFSTPVQHGSTTTMADVTVSAKNNDYNFRAYAQDGDSWFGVYDDANNSANIIVTRSDTTESFKHLGHTGETSIKASGTGLRIESSDNEAIQIAGNGGGLNFTTGANQRIYFGNQRALEGTSSSGVLQIGEHFSSGLFQMASNTFYGSVYPNGSNQYDLGSQANPWRDLYIGDLKLSNETREEGNDVDGTKGNWTIQEGESDLYIINNKNGKKYKFALEEI